MRPYDLPGPEFLGLYVGLLFATAGCAELLRWRLRKPGVEINREDPPLTPYEVAYLANGRRGAVNAAVAGLVRKESLTVDSVRRLKASESITGITHPLEWGVFEAVRRSPDVRVQQLSPSEPLDRIRASLEERGLLVAEGQRWLALLLPASLYVGLALFGLGKIVVGLERHKPVAFLIILVSLTAVAALVRLCWPVHRSRRGDDLLRRLRLRNEALRTTLEHSTLSASGDDVALGVALFGTGILLGGPLDAVARTIRPPAASAGGGWGAGCGNGGGSGCGGGGGGGCGGGGGGCGGCGGG
jgi:uncharacterized protein (TIGR04222 family)